MEYIVVMVKYILFLIKDNLYFYLFFVSEKGVLDFLKEAFTKIECIHAKLCWNLKENVQLIKLIEISVELVD